MTQDHEAPLMCIQLVVFRIELVVHYILLPPYVKVNVGGSLSNAPIRDQTRKYKERL